MLRWLDTSNAPAILRKLGTGHRQLTHNALDKLPDSKPVRHLRAVLVANFTGMLQDLPWWNRDWKVTHVEPGLPLEVASDHDRSNTRFTEVSVPGTVSSDSGETLPFGARVRFDSDRLIRFQAKIGDTVLGPAHTPAGELEPHPFAKVFTRLMDRRGIPGKDMARQTYRSMSTIHMLRSGRLNPHPVLAVEIATVLRMSQEDITAIAGLGDNSN